jgi:hypothetical protein
MRHESQVKEGDHFGPSLLRKAWKQNYRHRFSFASRFRPWLRLSLLPSLRGPVEPKGRFCAPQRGLRAWRFADIPTPLPIQNTTKEVIVMLSIHFLSASPALDACATTSALVRQRLSITSATVIALVLATPTPQPITGSALAPQHLAVNRSLPWGLA